MKREYAQKLIKKDQIFDSLLESAAVKETNGLRTDAMNAKAEQELIDLLCQAGFIKQDRWGCRWTQPNKTYINSLSVLPIQHYDRLFNKQKLMIFWRKPAVSEPLLILLDPCVHCMHFFFLFLIEKVLVVEICFGDQW